MKFRVISGSFAVCRLAAADPIPQWATKGTFTSVTRTEDELSIVCPLENVPKEHKPESPWTCLKIEGPFAFSQIGILHAFIRPLVEAGISILAIATYDTDYVLVQEFSADAAIQALRSVGHVLLNNN
ncbi:MAG TPA: ACT domain-containing protein [Terriglobales bacterium]|nr:ACT domain-containing protein [Terriglobales bacterium]